MPELKIVFGSQFKRDLKKQFLLLATAEWAEILYCLTRRAELPAKYSDHLLSGDWAGFRECHIKPDLLLIYSNAGDAAGLASSASGFAALARALACDESTIRAQLAELQTCGIVPLEETATGWQIRPALDLLDAAWLARACPAAAVAPGSRPSPDKSSSA